MEVTTKVVPVIQLGPRTLAMAQAVVYELRQCLQPGRALPAFSSDGLHPYIYASTVHCGHWSPAEGGRKREGCPF
jgi:hypothetical protein